jgi:hypothetical protein
MTTTMPNHDDEQYRNGALTVGPETETQEELERAKAGLDEPTYASQGYDPRQEPLSVRECGRELPEYGDRKKADPKVYSLTETVELWTVAEVGNLAHPTHDGGREEMYGVDVPLLAWEWVRSTEGWSPTVHKVMRHLFVRCRDWSHWPSTTPVLAERVTLEDGSEVWAPLCPWPFVTKKEALASWGPFLLALKEKARAEPFCPRSKEIIFKESA